MHASACVFVCVYVYADKDAAEGWGGLKPIGGLTVSAPSFGGLPFVATQRIANGTVATQHGDAFSSETFMQPGENIVITTVTFHREVKNLSLELWTMGGECTGPFVNLTHCRSVRPTDSCAYPTGASVDATVGLKARFTPSLRIRRYTKPVREGKQGALK